MKKALPGLLILSALLVGFCAALVWRETVPYDRFVIYGRQEVPHTTLSEPSVYVTPGDGRVELNRAAEQELLDLPGIGPVLAERIIAYRTAHGGFTSPDELLEVAGIGEKTFRDILPYVYVDTQESTG